MAKDLAVILNNGSLNSCIATALALQKHRGVMLYAEAAPQVGSRARMSYDLQVAHFKPYREHVLQMPFLTALSHDDRRGATSAAAAASADSRQHSPRAPQMLELLPLIAAAVRFATHYQASAIFLGLRVGTQADELAQATEYVQIWNELINLPCDQPELELHTPLLELEPWQVVDLGFQVAAPLEKAWSCVEDAGEPCWACRGCRAREAAFQQAGKPDPMRGARKV
jgi:7-cyano-7-deazaguanine synthase in queuosine biosynthesis